MRIPLFLSLIILASPAIAAPHCTNEPESKWLTKSEMIKQIQARGHQIDVFKKTRGNCYEIYGRDSSGNRIEVYFHPISGKIVKFSAL